MNKEQQQIIDEVYEKYSIIAGMSTQVVSLTKEEFIHYIKTDVKFSETWGLKIEERELSFKERELILLETDDWLRTSTTQEVKLALKESNIPTKLITLTYNNKTITSYE
jgi:hypothetical protein